MQATSTIRQDRAAVATGIGATAAMTEWYQTTSASSHRAEEKKDICSYPDMLQGQGQVIGWAGALGDDTNKFGHAMFKFLLTSAT
jgi:hypothetical protein